MAVPIEVKSVRDWIYPTSRELFQLLHKAARIQEAAPPSALVLPVLVCRKAHYTTFRMAQQLGFFVVDLLVQYVSDAAGPEDHVAEVRNELGLADIRTEIEVDERLVRRVRKTLPTVAEGLANTWKSTVEDGRMLPVFDTMRKNLTYQQRQLRTRELRDTGDDMGLKGRW